MDDGAGKEGRDVAWPAHILGEEWPAATRRGGRAGGDACISVVHGRQVQGRAAETLLCEALAQARPEITSLAQDMRRVGPRAAGGLAR